MSNNCNKNCGTCKYFGYDRFGRTNVCVNDQSEHVVDFVNESDVCDAYTKITNPVSKYVEYALLLDRINQQRAGISSNPDSYDNAQELLDEYELIEEWLEEFSYIDNTMA